MRVRKREGGKKGREGERRRERTNEVGDKTMEGKAK